MQKRTFVISVLAALVLLLPACARIETPAPTTESLAVENLPSRSSLPAQWGNLVSVSSVANYPDLVQLWFQDADGNIRMVVFNLSTNEFLHARRIGRQ